MFSSIPCTFCLFEKVFQISGEGGKIIAMIGQWVENSQGYHSFHGASHQKCFKCLSNHFDHRNHNHYESESFYFMSFYSIHKVFIIRSHLRTSNILHLHSNSDWYVPNLFWSNIIPQIKTKRTTHICPVIFLIRKTKVT